MVRIVCLFTVCFLLFSVTSTKAAFIDFEGLTSNISAAGNQVPVAGSVLTDQFLSEGVVFGKDGVSTGVAVMHNSLAPSSGVLSVVGLNAEGLISGTEYGANVGDIYFSFFAPGTNDIAVTDLVEFTVGDAGYDVDVFDISYYDASDNLISSVHYASDSRIPVSISNTGIHSVAIDFTGDYGYSLDDLSFNTPVSQSVPEPGASLYLIMGIFSLVGIIRKKS